MNIFLLIYLNYAVIMFQKNITMHEIKLLRISNVSKDDTFVTQHERRHINFS